jgi:imidazole glycerol-phosphate synthase subunit HisH
MITIVNYGMGNLGSLNNMFKKLGIQALVTDKFTDLQNASKIILPGVGAFDNAMINLKQLDFLEILNQKALVEKIPILGICLGMQLLTQRSEEGTCQGLGWFKGKTIKFNLPEELKIPHMGWNSINIKRSNPLLKDLDNKSRFYFVHSYHVTCDDPTNILTTTSYGINFISMIQHQNIYGAQFHPEKSHRFGMQLLKNFSDL